MSYVQRIVALVSGIMLLPVSLYDSGLVLNAIPIPMDYESFSTRPSALALMNAVPCTLCFALSMAWSWVTLRWLARPPRVAVWWCFAGLVAGIACLPFISAVESHYSCLDYVRHRPEVHWDCSFLANLDYGWLSIFSPWNRLPATFLAVLSGLAAAAAMVLRSERVAVHEAHA
jgi:hypothetical protein